MKAIERRVKAIESTIDEQFYSIVICELKKDVKTQRPKAAAFFDDMYTYAEIVELIYPECRSKNDFMVKFRHDMITILDHHLPECSARIREQLTWL